MRKIAFVAVTWVLLVGTIVAAKAEDTAVFVPAGCKLPADSMAEVHIVLCHSDTECTQRVVDVVCDYNHPVWSHSRPMAR